MEDKDKKPNNPTPKPPSEIKPSSDSPVKIAMDELRPPLTKPKK